MISTIEIRQDFINFFRQNGHKYMPPSKVFIDDPTLFFVNAGMNQLKDIFLGNRQPKEGFTMLANSQICIRAGGKHNDLDDCGFDSTHLTSFEMLGNWSIAEYQKEGAIDLAFRYLTENCNLSPERMYVTYFEGSDDIPPDNETRDIWKKYLPDDRIVPGNFKDNFWMMGDTGPCGACTEIHYDLDSYEGTRSVPELVNKDDPTVIEIWNNVFMEYNKDSTGYHKLDNFYVDTGMGLERLAMIMQDKNTVYQTDAFRYLIGYAQALTNSDFYEDVYDGSKTNVAYRIFADHIRTVVVALFDGVKFGTNHREFVLRKIFRRLLTYMYLYLNNNKIEQRFTHPLVKSMISDIMIFHLKKKHDADAIWKSLITEEKLYIGRLRFVNRKVTNALKKANNNQELAFKRVYDSSGIPIEMLKNYKNIKIV